MYNPIFLTDNDIRIELYLIGYKSKGESIVLILRDNRTIFYTSVIDAFKYYNINKTIELLDDLQIKHVDMLCLTHPHHDHYFGIIDLFKKYEYKKIKQVVLPIKITPQDLTTMASMDDRYKDFKKIYEYISKYKDKFEDYVLVSNHRTILQEKTFVTQKDPTMPFCFKVNTIAPYSCIIEEDAELNLKSLIEKKKLEKLETNNFSIGIEVTFGDRKIYFLSDMLNKTFDKIKHLNHTRNEIDFIKIPHHGSPSSNCCLNLIKRSNINIIKNAGVTSYKENLPNLSILNEYKKITQNIYCTSNIKEFKNQRFKLGLSKFIIPLSITEDIEVINQGNSIEYKIN